MNRKKLARTFSNHIKQPHIGRWYLIASIVVLFVSTVAWALVGSYIQLGNADQLANAFITQHLSTALLPDQHTFLLKLPFFYLVQDLGATPFAFCFVTVLLVVLTVGLFAFILSKIEKRPYYLGTIFLALALVLMMIPAQSYAGANLPVNMAMLTTRNLEYVVYIGVLVLVLQSRRWLDWKLVIAALLMMVLVASDKLFLSVGVGAALITLVVSFLPRQLRLRRTALRWLAVSVAGTAAATLLLLLLGWLHVFQSVGQGSVGPYGFTSSIKGFAEAIFYGILSLFTNVGANPGFDARTPGAVIQLALGRLAGPLLPVYLMTLAIFGGAIVAVVRLVRYELTRLRPKKREIPFAIGLAVLLVASTLSALFLSIITNHYYPVDARYVSIVTFAGFVAIAAYSTILRRHYREQLVVVGGALVIGVALSGYFLSSQLNQQAAATKDLTSQNNLVVQTLKLHPAQTLLGDYWRVMPIKLASSTQNVDPLVDCMTSRGILNNTAWTNGDTSHSFAYLLTLGNGSANFQSCTLQQVTATYGHPDSSIVIAGTQKDPKELLLFYDKGVHVAHPNQKTAALTDTVLPAPLSSLTNTSCANTTVMNIVAHEDDDILFMNPDILHEIQAGDCVRSVYVTAGDAGSNGPYWVGRQKGVEAAYATMLGLKDAVWTEHQIQVSPNQLVTVANPRGIHTVSLVFMHLPDGSPSGRGFAENNYETLARLHEASILSLKTVDGSSTYTSTTLVSALMSLINTFKPDRLQTQSTQASGQYIDHSDHTVVGSYAHQAATLYQVDPNNKPLTVAYYLGYPIHALAQNVSDDDFNAKVNIFTSFSHYDGATCQSLEECDNTVYGIYLRRQYTADY